MLSTKEYKDYIIECLRLLDNVKCKPMMGGYLLYYNNVLFGGIYSNRLLVKMVETNKKYNMDKVISYDGSKKLMYLVSETDNIELVKDIVLDTYNGIIG